MEKFVVDTNLFFNLQETGSTLGKTTEQAIKSLNKYLKRLREKIVVYIPPSIVKELKSFFEKEPDYLQEFLILTQVKSPDRHKILISGQVFFDFVQETRHRVYRGLKIAEEELKKAAEIASKKDFKDRVDFEKKIGETIKNLRERYRNATRTKFLDSKADVDILLLAKELNATLVTTDEGILLWADKLGIKTLQASLFKQRLESLLN